MKIQYEIKHCGKSKKFDNLEEAVKFGSALEKIGYKITLNKIINTVYTTLIETLYITM